MDEKTRKDLTSLSDLEPTAAPEGAEREPTFQISADADALPALEGLDDLLAPMSPTEAGQGSSSVSEFEGLPPIDPEIQSLAEAGARPDPDVAFPPMPMDLDSETTGPAESLLDDPLPGPVAPESLEMDATEGVPTAVATPVGAAIAASLQEPKHDTRHYSDHVAASSSPTLASNPYS